MFCILRASQVVLVVKNLPANAGDKRYLGLTPGSGRSPRGGYHNLYQYSCLENPMDRGAWWATVHRVAKSQTWLKWLSMHTHTVSWRTFPILSEYFLWADISVVPPKNLPHWFLVVYVQWIWCVGGIWCVQWIWGSWVHSCIFFHVKCVPWSDAMLLRILFPKPWTVILAEAVWAWKANPCLGKISVPVMMNHWTFHLPYKWWGTL